MDFDWPRHKSALKRAYFSEEWSSNGSDAFMCKNTASYEDFWKFFDKYVQLMEKSKKTRKCEISRGRNCNDEKTSRQFEKGAAVELNELGVPVEFRKFHKKFHAINLDKPKLYVLKSYNVPDAVRVEFEHIIDLYLNFLQREKMTKLKKLRQSQRDLPIFKFRREIVEVVRKSPVTIIAGDTGCGKSTQVPQYLLNAGFENICCTQPRRIACISLAKRVAFETLNEYGSKIAYQIRFEKTKTSHTKMLFLTEGLLLRQMSTEPDLTTYNVIILDEIHERHLQGDFLLGVLKRLIQRRSGDLKLILMSATINLNLFADYFQNDVTGRPPIVNVPGRLYPIQLEYHPVEAKDDLPQGRRGRSNRSSEKIDPAPYLRIMRMIDGKYKSEERGDMLIFLSGISEITTVAESLKEYAEQTKRWLVLTLHSTLSIKEQDRAFDLAPENVRKCVLSTNIAETSVTIDGVRFVVDSGKAKEMRHDSDTKTHRLQEIWVSKASAEQRKGRAGRTGPGVCFRLFSEVQYQNFDQYSASEIKRVALESLVLQMFNLDLPDPRKFDFIEPPDQQSIDAAIDYLRDQNALTKDGLTLTPLGRMLVNLPVDVCVGKMLIMGCLFDRYFDLILTVAAALSVQQPFTQSSYRDADCRAARARLLSDQGDQFTLIKVYREWLRVKLEGEESSTRWCKKKGIEEQRLYEITKLRNQFKEILQEAELLEKCQIELTSVERRIRQGELSRLKRLKNQASREQKRQKVLKMTHFDDKNEDDEEGGAAISDGYGRGGTKSSKDGATTDVGALEFDVGNTRRDLADRVDSHKLDTNSATVLKFVLAAALYPQYGVLDPGNSYKVGSDLIVHTKRKPFVVLHPNGSLCEDPEILCFTKPDEKNSESANHQAIFYSMLLETTKPYLVNTCRLPALHHTLLVSGRVDTSPDSRLIVCDDFVEFRIDNSEKAAEILASAFEIRRLFAKCLERKLNGDKFRSDHLSHKLIDYCHTEVWCTVRRLLRPKNSDAAPSFDQTDFTGKTGKLTDSSVSEKTVKNSLATSSDCLLNFGVLPNFGAEKANEFVATKWRCEKCFAEFYLTLPLRLEHMESCHENFDVEKMDQICLGKSGNEIIPKTYEMNNRSLKKSYECEICDQTFFMTPSEFLKHKKHHKN